MKGDRKTGNAAKFRSIQDRKADNIAKLGTKFPEKVETFQIWYKIDNKFGSMAKF